MRPTTVAGAFSARAQEHKPQKSTISHRGFHDTKNGGFSTIDTPARASLLLLF
jgi:hypothetical protein